MKYTLIVTAAEENSIPLVDVAECLARHAASGYGSSKLHEPTLRNTRRHSADNLLDAVARGQLIAHCAGDPTAPRDLSTLTVTTANLKAWGDANGDDFLVDVVP